MSPEERYAELTELWLESMRRVTASKEGFYEGLRAAIEELEIEIQAIKEVM